VLENTATASSIAPKIAMPRQIHSGIELVSSWGLSNMLRIFPLGAELSNLGASYPKCVPAVLALVQMDCPAVAAVEHRMSEAGEGRAGWAT
jgi:hypothetical protein